MKNIAIISKTDNFNIFNLCGAEKVFQINNTEKLENLVDDIAKEYKIILVEEEIMNKNQNIFLKFKNKKLPAITAIPSLNEDGNDGLIYSLIKKVVGAEIAI